MTTQTLNLKIQGLSCERCEQKIVDTLSKLEGIHEVSVSAKKGKAKVDFNPYKIKEKKIEDEIIKLGYQIKKGIVQKWLERMAESNEKQFGSNNMDCCSVNKK